MLKRIKIHATPRSTGLPWGLSLAAGIAVVVMTLGSQMTIYKQPTLLMFPSETETLKVREIAVDVLRAPGTSVMAGKQGHIDGTGMDQRSPQNTSLLAPARGGGTWTQKADMPTARYIPGSAVVNGKIYVIGGAPFRSGFLAVVEEYDPATDAWTKRANMPTARQGPCAAAVGGIIYAIGGWYGDSVCSTVEAYDPATDTWTTKADMPTARTIPAIAVVDGIIYVIGGNPDIRITSAVEAYNPATDMWTTKADMPTARYLAAACVVDGRIYVFGGLTAYSGGVSLTTVEVYDPATDIWTQAADMPWPRMGHCAGVLDGKMYIIAGIDAEMLHLWVEGKLDEAEVAEVWSTMATVDVYDPGTDTWTTAADFPNPRQYLTAAVVDGRIYTIGGQRSADDVFSIVEEFDPGLPDSLSTVSPAGKLLETWGQIKKVQ